MTRVWKKRLPKSQLSQLVFEHCVSLSLNPLKFSFRIDDNTFSLISSQNNHPSHAFLFVLKPESLNFRRLWVFVFVRPIENRKLSALIPEKDLPRGKRNLRAIFSH